MLSQRISPGSASEWRRRRGASEGGGGCAARGRPLYEWRDRVGALSVQSGLAGRAGSDRPRYAALAVQEWILGSGPVACGAGPAGGKAPPGGMVARGILGGRALTPGSMAGRWRSGSCVY